jgi:hypothetical protein
LFDPNNPVAVLFQQQLGRQTLSNSCGPSARTSVWESTESIGNPSRNLEVREQQRGRQQHIHRPSLETQKAQTWTDGQSTVQTSKVGSPQLLNRNYV